MLVLLLRSCALLLAASASALAASAFLGIQMQPARTPQGAPAIRVEALVPGSCAARSALRPGDLILAWDEHRPQAVDSREWTRSFADAVSARMPGDRLDVRLLRPEWVLRDAQRILERLPFRRDAAEVLAGLQKRPGVQVELQTTPLQLNLCLGQPPGTFSGSMPGVDSLDSALAIPDWRRDAIEALLRDVAAEPLEQILALLDSADRWDDGRRLPHERILGRDPLLGLAVQDRLRQLLASSDLAAGLAGAAQVLGVSPGAEPALAALPVPENPRELLDLLESRLSLAAARLGWVPGTSLAASDCTGHLRSVLDAFAASKMFLSANREGASRAFAALECLEAQSSEAMLRAARELLPLLNVRWLQAVRDELVRLDPVPEYPLERQTDYGKIRISSSADELHDDPVALQIDLGGDDTYQGAWRAQSQQPLQILIDLAGDDRYQATAEGGFGAADGAGVSLLLDVAGDDQYQVSARGLGWGLGGLGMVIDRAGNDRYIAGTYALGAAIGGIGLVRDLAGDDRYRLDMLGMGMGGPMGLGGLLDREGNDEYRAGLFSSGSYGVPGVFRGSALGFGLGWRPLVSGGLGWFLDESGDDQYDAGNFSIGGGYFRGLGVFSDQAGMDSYRASRYGLGFSAHQAAGIFVDESGADAYECSQAACLGAAWDQSRSWFVDQSPEPNLVRAQGSMALGAAAHSSLAIAVMRHLDARSHFAGDGPGSAHRNDYHDGRSLGLWVGAPQSAPERWCGQPMPRVQPRTGVCLQAPADFWEGDRP